MYLSALQSLIPPLFAVVLQNAPFTSTAKLHGDTPAIEGRATAHTHTHFDTVRASTEGAGYVHNCMSPVDKVLSHSSRV